MLQILKPTIFPKNILAGYTEINPDLSQDLPNGLDFRIKNQEVFQNSLLALSQFLGLNKARFVTANQVHRDTIILANDPDLDYFLISADALITQNPEIIPCVRSADCGNLLIFDPVSNTRAVVHSGYKGTMLNIAAKTVEFMVNLGSKAGDLLVFMGPNIEPEALWVWNSVVENCPDEFKMCVDDLEPAASLAKYLGLGKNEMNNFPKIEQPAYLLDLKAWIQYQLLKAGVLHTNIEITKIGTFADIRFHSQRRARIVENSDQFGVGLGFIALS